MTKERAKMSIFLFILFKILYVTWSSSAFSSAAKTLSDDGLLRWEKRMTSVCGHLHLSSSYPEIYGCSHTTVIISSSGVISFPSPVKWSLAATYVNTVFLQPKFSDAWSWWWRYQWVSWSEKESSIVWQFSRCCFCYCYILWAAAAAVYSDADWRHNFV